MGVLESRCPECARPIRIVFHDRSLETIAVERSCPCAEQEPSFVLD